MVEINILPKDNTTFSGLIQNVTLTTQNTNLVCISISESMVMNILLLENKIPIVIQIYSI